MDDYNTKLASATSNGANVNLGVYNGALTVLKAEGPRLVVINCVNHRLELGIRDAVKDIMQFECKKFYTNTYLFKISGKYNRQKRPALGITHYPLLKIHGTCFVSHQRWGFTKLLHIWPSLSQMP